jgi:ATP-dependent helicase/nuclease subunit A
MLTQHQREALAFDGHLSVTANAGTGKTRVLVERFLKILLETETQINQVVAITFTDKAASELRARIAQEIRASILTAADERERFHREKIRDTLAEATICTIHAFCAQILREFPVEADIDAGFTILEGIDHQFLINDALRETVAEMYSADDPLRTGFLQLSRSLGVATVEKYLKALLRNREQLQQLAEVTIAPDMQDAVVLQRWDQLIDEELGRITGAPALRSALQRLAQSAAGKRAPELAQILARFLDGSGLHIRADAFRDFLDIYFTQKKEPRKEVIGKAVQTDEMTSDQRIVRQAGKLFTSLYGTGIGGMQNAELLRLSRILLLAAVRIGERYARKKADGGYLDFDDLQIHLRNILKKEEIRSLIANRYRYLMIDEFQDTNHLQYEIVRLLIDNFRQGNLFIVGDPKQSIYGFRNAEVEVFEQSKRDIAAAGEAPERSGVVLAESFRLLPALTAFTNMLFSKLMQAATPYDVGYTELVCARRTESEGRVEFLLLPPEQEKRSIGDIAASEARLIASRIAELHSSQYAMTTEGGLRPFSWGDAAVLLRKRTHMSELEEAFREYGIPFVLSGGRGYYQAQEIYDILNYLTFLINRDDDVALTGILRSPYFALSDAALFELAIEKGKGALWEKAKLHSKKGTAGELLRRAVIILCADLELANRIPIPALIQRICQSTGWYGTVAGLNRGGQATANIEKLLAIARDFESRGFLSLYDFVERIKLLADEEEQEGQAPSEVTDDVVHLMTIHGAKGLEFPVVFLPFLHHSFQYDRQLFLDPAVGAGFAVPDGASYDEKTEPPLYRYLKQKNEQKTDAEEKRIFYVGVTRARDLLILSGSPDSIGNNPSFLKWTMESLPAGSTLPTAGGIAFPPTPLKRLDHSGTGDNIVASDYTLRISVSSEPPARRIAEGKKEEAPKMHSRPLFLAPLAGNRQGEYFAATQIRTFLECPAKFHLKYVLGIPEGETVPANFDEYEEPNDRLRGELLGTLTHRVLQHLPEKRESDEELKEVIAGHLAAFPSIDPTRRESYAAETVRQVKNFVHSNFGKAVLQSKNSKTEFSITTVLGEDFLTGTIDRLYQNDEGRWALLDYKTDAITNAEIGRRAESYKIQVEIYALLISLFFDQPEVDATILFLRHTDKPVHYHFKDAELKLFRERISASLSDIKSGKFFLPSDKCADCSYAVNGRCIIAPR